MATSNEEKEKWFDFNRKHSVVKLDEAVIEVRFSLFATNVLVAA